MIKVFMIFQQKIWPNIFEAKAKINICRAGLKIFPVARNLTARRREDFEGKSFFLFRS
jgi:hypothetical protein